MSGHDSITVLNNKFSDVTYAISLDNSDNAIIDGNTMIGDRSSSVPGWTYVKKVSVSPGTPVNNYQVKVILTAANFDYANADADGDDIRFYDKNGIKY